MNNLSVKGYSDRIELVFLKDTDINTVKEELSKLSEEEKNFFTDDNAAISYSGTEFSYDEEIKLEKIIRKNFGRNISFIKKQRLSREKIRYSLNENENICKIIEKSLRSGDEVSFEGDVIVYGDVNPGAKITAQGNITIIGALRGSAWIKTKGRVYATYMSPSQIKIGKICSYNKRSKNVGPAIAMAENGEIILQCL